MNTYQITVMEPRAIRLLEDMANENLIKIRPTDSKDRFRKLLRRMRSVPDSPSFDEITREVEAVREERHARQKSK